VKSEQLTTAVLTGGPGREREVSIESGRCVAEALEQAGVKVVVADVKPDKLSILDDKTIDVFFVAIHGTFGEDGEIQQILENKGLIYTGSGPEASKLAFDKWESKKRFTAAGIDTPEAIRFEQGTKNIEEQIRQIGQKYVIKPVREGSTIGITIANEPKAAIATAEKCAEEFGDCMIERFVSGREITVGILGEEALPILEIRPKNGFYDYHSKYIDDKTQYLFDTIDEPTLVDKIQKSAIDCFNALCCRGVARVDFILDEDNRPNVLEINTIPGMTNHSLLPKEAQKAGISMSRLCLRMVEMALAGADNVYKKTTRIQ